MGYVEGTSPYQVKLYSLDDMVAQDHMVRLIGKFVDILDMKGLGFEKAEPKGLGRPGYDPRHMLKLYLYGYEEGIRSSRKLEHMTKDSLSARWLMEELSPDFKTIADFRKDNIEAIQKVFYEFGSFLDSAGCFGKKIVAIDGTKVKASNNKKTNYSRKKIERRIEYNKESIARYMKDIDAADTEEELQQAAEKIADCRKRIGKYEAYQAILDGSGGNELSETDPDARLMGNNKNGVDVAYNVQASVDAEHHMVIDHDITQNPTDHDQLYSMMNKSQETLRKKDIVGLADKGYYNAEQLKKCEGEVLCIVPKQKSSGDKGKEEAYHIKNFVYDYEQDHYTCPSGNILQAFNSKTAKKRRFFNKEACNSCPHKTKCLTKKQKFRVIRRDDNTEIRERADKRYEEYKDVYKIRQQTVEHVFATVKRGMGGGHFLLRTKEKVKCESSLMFLGYNFKRCIGLLGAEEMMGKLEEYAQKIGRSQAFSRFIHHFVRCTVLLRAAA